MIVVANIVTFLYRFKNVNINVAVQTENGLYVPVVKVCSK